MDYVPVTLNETELSAWLTRIANGGQDVKDPGRDTVILLLRLNLAVDELTRVVRGLATKK